ncbi:arginine--tRNA ligase [Rurimicrobium arvi]|uniref:Arginine--tRNA ligase n=1 Tax=Rurimicrobium arvi TaxID=2049916 RepID=A0ABP8N2U1_9BACT
MLTQQIKSAALEALQHFFPDQSFDLGLISVNETKSEFTGDYTVVLFPFVKMLRQKPDELGNTLGVWLTEQHPELFTAFQVVSGFLNLTVNDRFFLDMLSRNWNNQCYGTAAASGKKVMIEYSSPNTNKPLHFGHLRNNFLGYAVGNILKVNGDTVVKANLVNDRGIHICKSMVAWQHFAQGATPESSGIKGDHLVGDYYVRFNDEYKAQVKELMASGMSEELAEKEAPIMKEAQQMLRAWEAGDEAVVSLWKQMNAWVYAGFDITYKNLGIDFDKFYYESNTYLLGKAIVEKGLEKGVLFRKEDNSVWIDLTADGLDQKLLLRGDGTSVYMTQDLGTAVLKYNDFGLDRSVYVIADEQNYHMQVLQLILKKLGEPCADGIFHLSYGMVELPSGRMKSREGTVVDADDMIEEMISMAEQQTKENGKADGFSGEEQKQLYRMIGLGALKFYLLRVDPKKKMIFNPQESIDLHGFTATFIQYAHARICSVLRKEQLPVMPAADVFAGKSIGEGLFEAEKHILKMLEQYPVAVETAAKEMSPSVLCNYCFSLAQAFNTFYDRHSIAKAESEEKKQMRLMTVVMIARTLRHAMSMLGIELPEKM